MLYIGVYDRDAKYTIMEKIEKNYQTSDQYYKPMMTDGYYVWKQLPQNVLSTN